ncbi:MAG: kelch motif-containing protein [Thermoproteota archaeon]|nr:kelch motif-containing protein [Thermoproteota archaeon]
MHYISKPQETQPHRKPLIRHAIHYLATLLYEVSIFPRWVINLESMSSKRSGIAADSINNYIYVFGGEERSKTSNNNEEYDVIIIEGQ